MNGLAQRAIDHLRQIAYAATDEPIEPTLTIQLALAWLTLATNSRDGSVAYWRAMEADFSLPEHHECNRTRAGLLDSAVTAIEAAMAKEWRGKYDSYGDGEA